MSEFYIGGAPTKMKELYLNDGTASRKLKELWYHDGTAVRKVYSGVGTPALSNQTFGGGNLTFQLRNDGTMAWIDADDGIVHTIAGQWLTGSPTPVDPTDAGAWECVFTYMSGPNPQTGGSNTGRVTKSGSAYGTTLNLSTTQQINLTGTPGSVSGTYGGTLVFNVLIRLAGGGTTLATANITLNISG